MFDEYFKSTSVVSTPISVATLLPSDTDGASSSTTIDQEATSPSNSPNNETSISLINSTNVERNEEVAEFDSDTFTNPFAPPDTSSAESSSRIVDTLNMHTFQQPLIYTQKWTKDHPLVTIIGDPSKPVSTRCQLSTDALWCYFHAFLAKEEPKNYKEAMENPAGSKPYKRKSMNLSGSNPRGIFINQSKYALEMLKKYGFEKCDVVDIPMVGQSKLDEDPNGTPVDPTPYLGMVGSLMCLTASRLHVCSVPGKAYRKALNCGCQDSRKSTSGSAQFLGENLVSWSSKKQKCIVTLTTDAEYISLSGCCAQILWMRSQLTDYGFDFNKILLKLKTRLLSSTLLRPIISWRISSLKHSQENASNSLSNASKSESRVDCYYNAGFETDRDDIKSQTGYVFVLNGGAVDSKSSKQSTIAMSATEAEYIAASEAAMEAVWIRKFISGLGIIPTINEPIKMFCDNSTALLIANEPGVQRGARHYHKRYHYVRECIVLGEINLLKVYTDDNLADPFTKALPKGKVTQHARSMRLRLASSFM
ncbi:hypothetical protein Tco_1371257 [Tanacetum coccineum]